MRNVPAVSPANTLRFAALVRVSTPGQGTKGESLETQRQQVLRAVQRYGGEIVMWFDGQEHSSGTTHRPIFERLLQAVPTGQFDAVIVAETTRVGRNMEDLLTLTTALLRNGVRFFDERKEHDLVDRAMTLMEGVLSEAGARRNSRASLLNRIARAARGWPMGGSPPFGRRLVNPDADRNGYAQWEVIPEDYDWVHKAWRLYVYELRDFRKVAEAMGLGANKWTTVRERLFYRSGGEFKQHFRSKLWPINETVITKVPPLLTDEQLAAARAAAKSHKQWRTVNPSRPYPLAHYVRCAQCGETYHGVFEPAGKWGRVRAARFYRHARTPLRTDRCVKQVRAMQLEQVSFQLLGFLMSRTENLREAVENVLGTHRLQQVAFEAELEPLEKARAAAGRRVERLVAAVAEGGLSNAEVAEQMARHRAEQQQVAEQLTALRAKLAALKVSVPKDAASRLQRVITKLVGESGRAPSTWQPQAQEKLAQFVFGRGDKALGVFVRGIQLDRTATVVEAEVRGIVGLAVSAVSSDYPEHPRAGRFEAMEVGRMPEQGLKSVLDDMKPRSEYASQKAKIAKVTKAPWS